MLPEMGPVGGAQGFEPGWQIWPTAAFPLATLLTDQLAAPSGVFVTTAEKELRWPIAIVPEEGEVFTLTLLVMVIVADTVAAPAVA
jgi:hypothetical protein